MLKKLCSQVVVGSEDLAANHDVMQIVEVYKQPRWWRTLYEHLMILSVYFNAWVDVFSSYFEGLGWARTRWAFGFFAREIPQVPKVPVDIIVYYYSSES